MALATVTWSVSEHSNYTSRSRFQLTYFLLSGTFSIRSDQVTVYGSGSQDTFLGSVGGTFSSPIVSSDHEGAFQSYSFEPSPPLTLSCNATGSHPALSNLKIGDAIQVTCPKHCVSKTSIVHGDGEYSSNSMICPSAVHAGVVEGEYSRLIFGMINWFKNVLIHT